MPKKARRASSRPGFSLVEMTIAIVMASLVSAAILGLVVTVQRQYATQRDTRMAEESLRVAEMVLRRILQGAGADPMNTGTVATSWLNPNPLNAASFNNVSVMSDFNPPNGVFTDTLENVTVRVVSDSMQVRWTGSGSYQTLAYPVRSLQFEYFSSTGAALTTSAAVANAVAVRFTVTAPTKPGASTLLRRQSWVYLQNRRS